MKDYRYKAQSLGDLLHYGLMIKEGLMVLKDGAFSAGWRYHGLDMHSATIRDMALLRIMVNQAFCQLGDGWMLHADMIRRPVTDYADPKKSYFPDATSFFIDEERRQLFLKDHTHFISDYTFIITYKPPRQIQTTFKKVFIHTDQQQSDATGWGEVLRHFETKLAQLENSLSICLVLKRLTTTALLTHLHTCITGLTYNITHPYCSVYLDQFLSTQDFVGGLSPKIGQKDLCVLAINGFPLASHPAMLKKVSELPISFRWSHRYLFLDPGTCEQQLKKRRRYWFQKRWGVMGLARDILNMGDAHFLDQDALEMTADVDNALLASQSNLVRYGYYTSVFILMQEPDDKEAMSLNASAKRLGKLLESKGFATRIETINAVEAYLGSLPGHGYQNVRKPMLSTLNLADLIPLVGMAPDEAYHPCPYYPAQSPALLYAKTQGHTPVRFNLHDNDVGHALVVGDTGSGKSTLLGLLMAQHLRYPKAQVFLFDKGYSSFALCHALSGTHYDIAGDDEALAFAPLNDISLPHERDWACEWLETVFTSQDLSLTPPQRQDIRDSLTRLSRQPSKTLTDLQASLQDKVLKQALEFYTLSGTMGSLLDASQDDLSCQHVQVFEMQHLLNKDDKFTLPVLAYLFHQIDRRLAVDKPTLIIIEEGHRFLKGRFGEQLEVWLRECRKQNAAVVFVTQGLSEIMNSAYKDILLNSCPSKLFLPNPHANAAYNKSLYHQAGLSDAQIQIIAEGIRKHDYYLTSPRGNRLMNFGLSAAFLALMASLNQAGRQHIINLRETHHDKWVYHYLLEKELPDAAENWLQAYHTLTHRVDHEQKDK